MIDALCRRAFFQFEFPVHYLQKPPRVDGHVRKWNLRYLAPPLVEIEGTPPIADVYWGWNEDGFYAAFQVTQRRTKPRCDLDSWWKGDGLRLCIDTRDTRDLKRATRFCHFFYLLPLGGGNRGLQPVVGTHRMSRAKEPPPPVDVRQVRVAAHVERTGYELEIAIPASCLNGWDPAEHPRIGLFYKIKDTERGSQHLTVDDELGWNVDPSTWGTGVLSRSV
ncbi:MAG: hypothetical protein IPM18_06145 [Phycisphaerales bacterium]|nr:hypothetical protein [Phycisphaerales bacterium]